MYLEGEKPKKSIFSGQNRKSVVGSKKDLIFELDEFNNVGLILRILDKCLL